MKLKTAFAIVSAGTTLACSDDTQTPNANSADNHSNNSNHSTDNRKTHA